MSTDSGMRWAHIAALLALGCGDGGTMPVPNVLTAPTCSWVEHAVIEPADYCRLFTQDPGTDDARFLSESDRSCQGATCLVLPAGQQAYVLGRATASYVDYDVTACSDRPECVP
jgi:hypothetical protein